MSTYEHITYVRGDDRIIRITLNRPEKANALNAGMLEELHHAYQVADDDTKATAIVLRGAGDKAFCAGADLGGMASASDGFLKVHDARGRFPKLFLRILRNSKPTIAAVNGHCVAGGLGLMLACDLAIVKRGAKLGTPEIKRGLFPFMISALLLRTVKRRIANEMMLLGKLYTAEEAAEMGLVNCVVNPEDFESEVNQWAKTLAGYSPAVLRLGRQSLLQQDAMPLEGAFAHLQGLISINAMLDDAKEGVDAFFEHRAPEFKGK